MRLFKHLTICIISIVVIFSFVYIINYSKIKTKTQLDIFTQDTNDEENLKVNISKNEFVLSDSVGYLTIEKINLIKEEVKDGVDDKTLKNNICHFDITPSFNGNVCLAAHNYSVDKSNLFKDLKKLTIGDNIVYETKYGKRKYKIYKIYEIKSNDFSILENTEENILTCITCVNNRKDIRLCVKALEIKEEK